MRRNKGGNSLKMMSTEEISLDAVGRREPWLLKLGGGEERERESTQEKTEPEREEEEEVEVMSRFAASD